jgi:hypothetical protein
MMFTASMSSWFLAGQTVVPIDKIPENNHNIYYEEEAPQLQWMILLLEELEQLNKVKQNQLTPLIQQLTPLPSIRRSARLNTPSSIPLKQQKAPPARSPLSRIMPTKLGHDTWCFSKAREILIELLLSPFPRQWLNMAYPGTWMHHLEMVHVAMF